MKTLKRRWSMIAETPMSYLNIMKKIELATLTLLALCAIRFLLLLAPDRSLRFRLTSKSVEDGPARSKAELCVLNRQVVHDVGIVRNKQLPEGTARRHRIVIIRTGRPDELHFIPRVYGAIGDHCFFAMHDLTAFLNSGLEMAALLSAACRSTAS